MNYCHSESNPFSISDVTLSVQFSYSDTDHKQQNLGGHWYVHLPADVV